MTIIDRQQAEETARQWRKEHPEEDAEFDRLWEESMNKPQLFIDFLESKGFTFTEEAKEQILMKHGAIGAETATLLLLTKYSGYAMFLSSLGLFLLSSLSGLGVNEPAVILMVVGVLLLGVSMLFEKVMSQ